jgi:hypothetical protein
VISAAAKVPLYSILGMSFTFVFLFVLVDLLNYCDCKCTCCADEDGGARPWVESEVQVYLLVVTALAMGFVFGLIFGLSDLEDKVRGAQPTTVFSILWCAIIQ